MGPLHGFPMPAGTRLSYVSRWCCRDTGRERSLLPDSRELLSGLLQWGEFLQCPASAGAQPLQRPAPAVQHLIPPVFGPCTACSLSSANYCTAVTSSEPSSALRVISRASGSHSRAASPVCSSSRMQSFSNNQILQCG